MSMSMYVEGFRDMDGEFTRMMDMKDLCDSRGFSYPKEVIVYFGNNLSESKEYLAKEMLRVEIPNKEFDDESCNGNCIEIQVKDIPKEVKTIRFTTSF